MLIYSLTGPSITLAQALPPRAYEGVWFDPRTGKTQALAAPAPLRKGTTISKPTGESWLLLLRQRTRGNG